MVRVGRIGLGLALGFIGVGCTTARETILECPAPDNAHVAVFFREYGGGAAGFQDEFVEVRKKGKADPVRILRLKHGYDIVLTWLSPMSLEIAYPDTARVDHWQD